MTTRYIEDLRGLYKGKEIWVLGCGPSLDAFPENFFDNKISIACNWAFIAFPNCTYLVNYHLDQTNFIRKYTPEVAEKWILWAPPEDPKNSEWVPQFNLIYMSRSIKGNSKEDFDGAVKAIMRGQPYKYVDKNTIAHPAIQAAAIMGAKKITLVGCEHRATKDKYHAQKRGLWAFYKEIPGHGHIDPKTGEPAMFRQGECVDGTVWFVEAFKRYGVEVRRYYHTTGYEEI